MSNEMRVDRLDLAGRPPDEALGRGLEPRLPLRDVEDLAELRDVNGGLGHPDLFSLPCFFAYCSPRLNTHSPSGIETTPMMISGQSSSHIAVIP